MFSPHMAYPCCSAKRLSQTSSYRPQWTGVLAVCSRRHGFFKLRVTSRPGKTSPHVACERQFRFAQTGPDTTSEMSPYTVRPVNKVGWFGARLRSVSYVGIPRKY